MSNKDKEPALSDVLAYVREANYTFVVPYITTKQTIYVSLLAPATKPQELKISELKAWVANIVTELMHLAMRFSLPVGCILPTCKQNFWCVWGDDPQYTLNKEDMELITAIAFNLIRNGLSSASYQQATSYGDFYK